MWTGVDARLTARTSPTAITITNNTNHDNTTIGSISAYTVASNNTIYNQTGSGQAGVQISGGELKNNVIYNNYYGIYGSGNGLVDFNRVFNNSFEGIYGYGLTIVSNTVYSNATARACRVHCHRPEQLGLRQCAAFMSVCWSRGRRSLANNMFTSWPVTLVLTSSENNLSFQKMLVSNNIPAPAGYDINMTDDSAIGLSSGHNDLVVTGNGQCGKAVDASTHSLPTSSNTA